MKSPIAEIYPAVQCEGEFNSPAVFVRFWGCNLRCGFTERSDGKFACDTPYAVFEGEKEFLDDVEIINKIKAFKTPHVVFTGGEPMMYAKQIRDIISGLPSYFVYEMETNGTLPPTQFLKTWITRFNVSVKLKSSNQWKGWDDKRINKEAIGSFPANSSIFKFVVSNEEDIEEIKVIAAYNSDMRVFLMPEGENREQVVKNLPTTLDLCMTYDYNFTNRDHIIAYSDKRGV